MITNLPPPVKQRRGTFLALTPPRNSFPTHTLPSRPLQQLILIRNSPRHVDSVVRSLQQLLDTAKKMERSARDLDGRRTDVAAAARAASAKLTALAVHVVDVKAKVEETLSAQFDGRPVTILGEALGAVESIAAAAAGPSGGSAT